MTAVGGTDTIGRAPGTQAIDRGIDAHPADILPPYARGPRAPISTDARQRFEGHLAEILRALGMDLETASTVDTPRRLLTAWIDATSGYDGDPKLVTTFPTECRDEGCDLAQVVEGPIAFYSVCEHHALPFRGRVWLGYIAHDEILGISKLTRLVRVLTRRFSVQERVTRQLADTLEGITNAHGVAVYVEAEHVCTQMRGVREMGSRTRTSAYRGTYEHDATLRSEFAVLAGVGTARP